MHTPGHEGEIKVGDEIVALPSGKRSTVKEKLYPLTPYK
ncbi:hypothetical protein J751_3603 [Acinetobacter baumannii 24812_8]|nr:hypothetical protein J751_3603 [Acinetobacter baumannii 24812_8]